MAKGCKAKNKSGERCAARHWQDGWCRWHHPALADERRENARRGGKARSNAERAKKRLHKLGFNDIDGILCDTLQKVLVGEVEPGVATATATLARTITQIRTASEVEARLAELESALGVRDATGTR